MDDFKAVIDRVRPDSIAEEMDIKPGDAVLSINGQKPRDLIDYRFLCADDDLEVEVLRKDGEVWLCDIQKDYDEDLGLGFTEDTFDGIRSCANKCIFCFVDQMPPDLRETLYVKDDDFRLSFLHGNFVTLTNLTEKDLERILAMRISPLYVSVHCTNPGLRRQMLGNRNAGKIMDQLSLLTGRGIEVHTQVVLCPGVNDGEELDRTVRDLTSLWPGVLSTAIVPVGLTRFRDNLPALRWFKAGEVSELIDKVTGLQEGFLRKYGSPLVYLADEFYVMAGRDFPPDRYYGGYPQLENGVGLVRLFYDSFSAEEGSLPKSLVSPRNIAVVTGVSGEYVLRPLVERLNRVENLHVELIGAPNEFFGGHVTVAGLLTGTDVVKALKERRPFDRILLPSVMCKRDEPVFLDGKRPADLEQELSTPVLVINIEEGAREFIKAVVE